MDARSTLIALNTHPSLQRSTLCRLALDLEAWQDLRPGSPGWATQAASLGVPAAHLRKALSVLPRAETLAGKEERQANKMGARILTRVEQEYPAELLDHPLPPPVLYCRGQLRDGPAIAMVGSRKMTSYGKEVAQYFARELARSGVTVVSGFARGVDQAAHRAAVEAGGRTVAVLGCGLDISYPANSHALAEAISQNGAVISEFPLGREPRAWHFPVRNRVIAALASGTLVVQAKERSGSLITAHLALELGRDVYAVPGSIFDELSMGTNGILADGAIPALSPLDILEHLSLGSQMSLFPLTAETPGQDPSAQSGSAPPSTPAGPTPARSTPARSTPASPAAPALPLPKGLAGRLIALIPPSGEAQTAEDLASKVDESVDRVLGALLELELSGWVERAPGPVYRR